MEGLRMEQSACVSALQRHQNKTDSLQMNPNKMKNCRIIYSSSFTEGFPRRLFGPEWRGFICLFSTTCFSKVSCFRLLIEMHILLDFNTAWLNPMASAVTLFHASLSSCGGLNLQLKKKCLLSVVSSIKSNGRG